MAFIILPIATMVIGFLLGIIATDCFVEDKKMNDLDRRVRMLERRGNR